MKAAGQDGGVSSPSPFYYTTNGYGVLRNTYRDGKYDFGSTDGSVVTATHNENEYDAYIFVSSSEDGSSVSTDLLDGYYTVTGARCFCLLMRSIWDI